MDTSELAHHPSSGDFHFGSMAPMSPHSLVKPASFWINPWALCADNDAPTALLIDYGNVEDGRCMNRYKAALAFQCLVSEVQEQKMWGEWDGTRWILNRYGNK